MKKGKLIVIEGTDGSGKKTQLELLTKKLDAKGIRYQIFDFPQYDKFFGNLVAQYLNGQFGELNEVDPKLISLLYALDRYQASEAMFKALNEGNLVLCNRYSISNQAHQTSKLPKSKHAEFLRWVKDLEYKELKIPKEDLVIFLDVPDKVANNLMKNRIGRSYTKKKLDLHEANKSYLQKTRVMYRELSNQQGWITIDCTKNGKILPKENISSLIWQRIQKLL